MYRATAAYALMIALSAAALWGILAFGSRLAAPTDLAGRWSINPSDAGPNPMFPDSFSIDQSGRFAMLRRDGHPPIAFTLQTQTAGDEPSSVRLVFDSPASTLTVIGVPGGNDFEFRLAGALTAQFHAHRTWSAYAPADSDSAAAPTTKP